MQQAHIMISGFVQGVGFRVFVKNSAEKYGLTGWVRNTEDGRVEALLQGEREGIEQVIKLSEIGPFMADVTGIDTTWQEISTTFDQFAITYS